MAPVVIRFATRSAISVAGGLAALDEVPSIDVGRLHLQPHVLSSTTVGEPVAVPGTDPFVHKTVGHRGLSAPGGPDTTTT